MNNLPPFYVDPEVMPLLASVGMWLAMIFGTIATAAILALALDGFRVWRHRRAVQRLYAESERRTITALREARHGIAEHRTAIARKRALRAYVDGSKIKAGDVLSIHDGIARPMKFLDPVAKPVGAAPVDLLPGDHVSYTFNRSGELEIVDIRRDPRRELAEVEAAAEAVIASHRPKPTA